MEEVKFEASIPGSTLTVYDDCVSFKHKGALGFLTKGIQGERKLYYSQISSVQFKDSNKLTSGFIEFYLIGHDSKQGGGLFKGTQNENRFYFYNKSQSIMEEAYKYIQKRIIDSQTQTQNVVVSNDSSADEIVKFKNLLDQGIITQEEFEFKKKQLLGL